MTTLTDTPLPHPPLHTDHPGPLRASAGPAVEIVLPVHNEQRVLPQSVRTLHGYLAIHLGRPFQITIADNASTDATLARARELAEELPGVRVLHLERKGRGNALRVAWGESRAEVVAYMGHRPLDRALLPARTAGAAAREPQRYRDRLAPGAGGPGHPRDQAGGDTRAYNILLRGLLRFGVSDAQCGFKAARRESLAPLLEEIEDDGWFFDTELLYLAQRNRLAIHEVPVTWTDDPDSRVDIIATALADLRGIARLRRTARGGPPRTRSGDRRPARFHRRRVVCRGLAAARCGGARGPAATKVLLAPAIPVPEAAAPHPGPARRTTIPPTFVVRRRVCEPVGPSPPAG